MLNAMQKILLRFHHIPSEDLVKMVLANKKGTFTIKFIIGATIGIDRSLLETIG